MSKQIYIDSNGNEVQISGTVNTADMMPMSGNDSTKVSEAIGDLSTLTTSVTSSLVGAVNEVNLPLFKITQFTKTYSISANGKVNFDRSFITIPTGYSIGGIIEVSTGQGSCALVSVRPTNTSQWAFEIVNTSSSAYSNQTFTISILFVKTSKVN